MPHLTHKDIEKMEYDKHQLQFALDGTLIINRKVLDENTPIYVFVNENNKYICPFCLEITNRYSVESHGLIKCPNCNNQFKLKTLLFIQECTNQDYAHWVYEYRLSGFFKKINFEKWAKQLKDLGMSYEFWEEYKKLKGEDEAFNEKPEEFNSLQLENIIVGLLERIKNNYTKEEILKELKDNNVEFNIKSFDYCFKEALKRR